MPVLVTGSIALDHIMVFPDRFRNHILPERIHMLNVAFHVPTLRRNFGGTAGNIAYCLRLLGEEPIALATVGTDFADYAEWLDRHGVRRDGIRTVEGALTAQCFITTDLDDNQIIAFHPGAMDRADEARIEDVATAFSHAIVSPNAKHAMQGYARELKRRGVPTMIDPSHQLPMFERDELLELIDGADSYVANDYEWALTCERTGLDEESILTRVDKLVVTKGGEGSTILTRGRRIEIPAVKAAEVVDPTGCGDAYRAGLLYGLARGLPLETSGRIGSLLGALVVAVQGPQGLVARPDEIRARFLREFGTSL
jgi:adenosine kinase